jgi:uncharacterized membrane protein
VHGISGPAVAALFVRRAENVKRVGHIEGSHETGWLGGGGGGGEGGGGGGGGWVLGGRWRGKAGHGC